MTDAELLAAMPGAYQRTWADQEQSCDYYRARFLAADEALRRAQLELADLRDRCQEQAARLTQLEAALVVADAATTIHNEGGHR